MVAEEVKALFWNRGIDHTGFVGVQTQTFCCRKLAHKIESLLTQDILEAMALWTPEEGVPQGSVISPLLSNLYLHSIDVAMALAGFSMVRYADDFVILCRRSEEAANALDLVRELSTAKGLSLHPDKTRVVDATIPKQGFDFLGYHFECGTRWPRKKSLKKLKDTLRAKTKRCNGNSLKVIIAGVNSNLKGWFEYFKQSHGWTFPPIDGWVRRRLRSILRKRSKRQGISRGYDHFRWPNRFFRNNGLFNLEAAHRSLRQSSAR